jgi:hypothetical protein
MNEEITATTTFDVLSMLVAFRWHKRVNWRQRFTRRGLTVLCAAAFIAAVDELRTELMAWLVIPASVGIGLIVGNYLEKRRFVSGLKSSPLLGSKLICKATEEALQITSPHSDGTLNWDVFHKTVSTPDGTLLYQQKYLFYWLPKTAFASESDYGRFLPLIAAKTKHSKLG